MRHRSLLLLLLCLPVAGASVGAHTCPRQPLDVEYYRFALTLTDATDRITGEATVRLL